MAVGRYDCRKPALATKRNQPIGEIPLQRLFLAPLPRTEEAPDSATKVKERAGEERTDRLTGKNPRTRIDICVGGTLKQARQGKDQTHGQRGIANTNPHMEASDNFLLTAFIVQTRTPRDSVAAKKHVADPKQNNHVTNVTFSPPTLKMETVNRQPGVL